MQNINSSVEELFSEYSKTRDIALRDELVVKHLYIAEILAKKYTGRGIDYDDLYQVASLALISAVERFDGSKGFVFSSFATPTIIGEIKKYFRDRGWMIRVPRRLQELAKKVNEAKNALSKILDRSVKVSDIAEKLQISDEEVMEAMEVSYVYSLKSLDGAVMTGDFENEVSLASMIGEEDKDLKDIYNQDYIDKCLAKLNKVEAEIIKGRFIDDKTQVEVAKELGISQMTVSRMEKKIITRFRKEYDSICGR